MKKNKLFYNGKIYTQAFNSKKTPLVANSMAVSGKNILAIGNNLFKDIDFKSYDKINLRGRAILPGLVDAHTHFVYMARTMGDAKLDGLNSLDEVLAVIKKQCRGLGKNDWVIGDGISPDRWERYIIPDRYMLDKVTGGRPAAIFTKDQHGKWVNSRALEIAGISKKTRNPSGGIIERLENDEPSGILKEKPAYSLVEKHIDIWRGSRSDKLFSKARKIAYENGVTGVHSFDDAPGVFDFLLKLSQKGKLGLRINYYPQKASLPELLKKNIRFDYGNDYFRVSGVKIFSDGALGSQSAHCFNKYIGSDNNFGVEVSTKKEILTAIKGAARLNLPCAIHAIGDKAISNVLDCFEKAPKLKGAARHRVEHVQMIRRKDIPRLKRFDLIASMQPSHCPSDINLVAKYWGKRGRNCYLFKTFCDKNIPLAFGSDAPIEPLQPIAGICAAVNRKAHDSGKRFYPEERITVAQAVYNYTVGPAYTVGMEYERGYLLPGYKADFIILTDDIYKVPKSKIKDVKVKETYFDGKRVFSL